MKTMKTKQRGVMAVVFVGLGLSPAMAAAAPTSPLADRVEAVIVPGRSLPAAMLGAPIPSYRVFADPGSGLAVIPMQIEERDAKGIILVTQGPHPDRVDGRFDAADELVFMARDSGAMPQTNSVSGCEKTALLTTTDKKSGAAGYVVLAQCANPPPLSTKDYVHLETNPYTAVTDRYRLGWHERLSFSYDYITVNDGPDILDRLRVRATIGKWGMNYTFDEDHFRYNLRGYNDGPVRVSWKADNYWSLGLLGKLEVPQYLFFYPESIFLQNRMDLTMNPALIGLDFWVEIGHDLSIDPARGYRVCSNVGPECLPLDHTIPDGSLKDLTEQKMVWGGVPGPEGALMVHIVVDPRLNLFVKGLFTFDPNFSSPPEFIKGSMPRISFYLVDWKTVKADKYDVNFYHFFLNNYSAPELERFDRTVTNPLGVSITENRKLP
jgi:hypothetical protein